MSFIWNFQQFDTDILGFRSAKITSLGSKKDIPFLIKDLKKNKIQYATYRIETNKMPVVQALEAEGFLLVDGIVALEADISGSFKKQKHIALAKKTEWKKLTVLAGSVFYANRFFNDPLIAKKRANKIYEEWILNSLKKNVADEVLIFKNKIIAGFITLQNSGHIPLIAVEKTMQGKGIGKALLLEGLRVLHAQEVKKAFIETQISNIPAIRSYQHCGFKITNSYFTYRWSDIQ